MHFFESYCEIIPEFYDFEESLKTPIPMHLRVNRLKSEPEELVERLKGKGFHLQKAVEKDDCFFWAPAIRSPGNLMEYFLGHIHPQALTSCLVSIVLSPESGSYVLDMCASPGGKTSHLAQLMKNTGLIIANEISPHRHIPLGNTLVRLGVLNTIVTAYQAQEFPLRQRFDYVLADVPCTGEGRFRKTKKSTNYKWDKGKARLVGLQKKIIVRGFDLLEDHGELIYTTCTYNPDENESVVDFLLKNREAELLPIDVGFKHEQGLLGWKEERYDRRLQRAARFYPHKIDSVGFFMARIRRRR